MIWQTVVKGSFVHGHRLSLPFFLAHPESQTRVTTTLQRQDSGVGPEYQPLSVQAHIP